MAIWWVIWLEMNVRVFNEKKRLIYDLWKNIWFHTSLLMFIMWELSRIPFSSIFGTENSVLSSSYRTVVESY